MGVANKLRCPKCSLLLTKKGNYKWECKRCHVTLYLCYDNGKRAKKEYKTFKKKEEIIVIGKDFLNAY